MRKRLRKKKHVDEYTEWGRQFIITRNRRDGFDEFLDVFIEEAIEANGCFCGGSGKEDKLDVVVELSAMFSCCSEYGFKTGFGSIEFKDDVALFVSKGIRQILFDDSCIAHGEIY